VTTDDVFSMEYDYTKNVIEHFSNPRNVGEIYDADGVTVTILVDDIAYGNLRSEHGLSIWVEYGNRRILFDTGPNDAVLENAKLLGVNLKQTDAIVLSHGHYDHTGGLETVLNVAPNATIYLHPAAIKPKFSQKNGQARAIGMSNSTKNLIGALAEKGKVVWTRKPTQVFPGLFVTGLIPRNSDFEDVGGAFFIDKNCHRPDLLPDDQALVLNLPAGTVVILGCAHAGVVNTLNYAAKLSGEDRIYTVIGGMHLLNASRKRINYTIDAFRQYNIQRMGPAHCTGSKAAEKFKSAFPDQCSICSVGTKTDL